MFSKLMEKQLMLSLHLDLSKRKIPRLLGKLLGIIPLLYSKRLEKKYLDESERIL